MRAISSPPGSSSQRAAFELLEALQKVISRAQDPEELLQGTLDLVLEAFDCDRAWLAHPCSLEATSFLVPMERTREAWPGLLALGQRVPMTAETLRFFAACLETDGPVRLGQDEDPDEMLRRFSARSMLGMAIRPQGDEPWLFGMHHCRRSESYEESAELFRAIGHRLADGITSLVAWRRLRQSEERFRHMVEHAPDAIVIYDLDEDRFLEANRNALELFDASRTALLAGGGPARYSPEFQPSGERSEDVARSFIEAALDGATPRFEWLLESTGGELVPCEVQLVRMPHPRRRIVRGSIVDITARRRAEEEREELEARLRQAQKMEAIGQLSGGVAHDFNNLLTVVIGNLELLDTRTLDESAEGCIADIRAAADRARHLTQHLLAFSRHQPLRPSAVDLARLLREMDSILRRTLREDIDIDLVLAGGLWTCEADESQLQNAILNLVLNSRDAMRDGGRLTIEANNARLDRDYASMHVDVRPGQYVCLAVSDEGSGIPPELQDQVFSPFFTTKQHGAGSGMGLAMVYGFVKQSGGHVKLYSEVGRGTTVKLYLPRAGAAIRERTRRPAPSVHEGAGESILVVEDAAEVRSLTRSMLAGLGYRVCVAAEGEEALAVLAEHPEVEVLLTDVVLPGPYDGATLARAALLVRPDLGVLYMSGYTENAIIHHGRLDPGVVLLEKPFTRRSLAARVAEVFAQIAAR